MESTEDWMRRIGSPEALEKRQELRLAGKSNAPIKGTHGLAALVGKRAGAGKKHSLTCECETCIPSEIKPWIEEMKKWNLITDLHLPKPVTVIPTTEATPKKRKGKWQQRGNSYN